MLLLNDVPSYIETEVQALVERMRGFGMRIYGEVHAHEGRRNNYTIVFVGELSDGSSVSTQGTINGHALISVNASNRTSILQDKLARIMKALMFNQEA